jgi:hypothetical protein
MNTLPQNASVGQDYNIYAKFLYQNLADAGCWLLVAGLFLPCHGKSFQ